MKRNSKRLLSLLLCFCMVAGLLPVTAGAVTTNGTMSATIYLDNGDGQWTDDEKQSTFAVDQTGLILDLRNFSQTIPKGETVASLAFYTVGSTGDSGSVFVFWHSESSNGTAHDKLYDGSTYNGVFQVEGFAPNGNGDFATPTPGEYYILAWVSNGDTENCYISKETFTITEGSGMGSTPTIDPSVGFPAGTANIPYDATLVAVPGTEGNTLQWTVSSGNLPDGLTLTTVENTFSTTRSTVQGRRLGPGPSTGLM